MRLTPNPTPTISGPRNGGGISFAPVLGRGPQGLPGPGSAAWVPGEAVATGAIRQAPDGSYIKATVNHTTRPSFDATEQGYWISVGADPTTFDGKALSASIDDRVADKRGAPSGIAALDSSGRVIETQLPARLETGTLNAAFTRPNIGLRPRPNLTMYTGTLLSQNGGSDSSDPIMGTTSLYAQTSGNGVGNSVRISGMALPNMTGKGLWVPIKVVNNITKIAKVFVQMGTDTSYANYYHVDLPAAPSSGKTHLRQGEWVGVFIPFAQFSVAAGSPTPSTLTSFKITVQDDNTGTGVRLLVGEKWGIYTEEPTTGTLMVSCDDTHVTGLDVCKKMAEYGWRPVMFPIVERLDSGAAYLTTAHLRRCHDTYGAEIGGHCMTFAEHVTMVGQTVPQMQDMLGRIVDWQHSMGFVSGAFAYPIGPFDQTVIDTVMPFFNFQRTNDGQVNPGRLYQAPVTSAFALGATYTLAQMKAKIDAAAANKAHVHFLTHDLLTSGTPTGNQWMKSDFDALIDYAAAQGLKAVMPSDMLGA